MYTSFDSLLTILFSLNLENCGGRLQWLSHKKAIQSLSVLTQTENVQIWDIEEAFPRCSFSRSQIKDSLKVQSLISMILHDNDWIHCLNETQRRQTETCYAVRCFQIENTDETLVLAGSNTPNRLDKCVIIICYWLFCASS